MSANAGVVFEGDPSLWKGGALKPDVVAEMAAAAYDKFCWLLSEVETGLRIAYRDCFEADFWAEYKAATDPLFGLAPGPADFPRAQAAIAGALERDPAGYQWAIEQAKPWERAMRRMALDLEARLVSVAGACCEHV